MYSVMNTALSSSDNDWIKNFHKIVLDSIPLPSDQKLFRQDDVKKFMRRDSTLICFDQLVDCSVHILCRQLWIVLAKMGMEDSLLDFWQRIGYGASSTSTIE